jgi:ribonuclease D
MAAPLIGMAEQISYAGLVAELLGVTLGKSHTRTDWSIRPLSDAQLRYAADDVIYLGPCYQALRNRLVELGRLTWLDDDFNSLLNPKLYQAAPEQAWLRIGGTQHLTGKQLTVLQALAAWRETKAREQNIPRNWVIKDEVVVDLARLGPLTANELQRLRGIDERTLKRYGEDLLRMIADSQNRPPLQATTVNRPQRPTPTPEREALLDMLGAAVRLLAARHSINPAVIASRKDLERLLDQPDDCKLLRGWRNAIAGHELLALLRGEKALLIIDGRLHVQPNQ